MAYKYVGKTCANCLKQQQVLSYYDDAEGDYEKFLHYANFELEVCENCGHTAKDIEKDLQKVAVNTKEYEKAKNYGYVPSELLQEYPYIFESYSANEYDALAVLEKQNNDMPEYAKTLFACCMQTLSIIEELKHELSIEGDDLTEKEIADYKKIIEIFDQELKNKCQKILDLNIVQNLFDQIIILICLKILQKDTEFNKQFKEIEPKISQKLKEYILEF